jgi:hypothetical protein
MLRLVNILTERRILGFRQFGADDGGPMVCFSDCSPAGARALVEQERYEWLGLAFTKDFAFRQWAAGPVLCVRGDEMQLLAESLRGRTVRYSPGTLWEQPHSGWDLGDPDTDEPSQWTYEREWRARAEGNPPGCAFELEDVGFLLGPEDCDLELADHFGSARRDMRKWVLQARWKLLSQFDPCRGNVWDSP